MEEVAFLWFTSSQPGVFAKMDEQTSSFGGQQKETFARKMYGG